MKIEQHVQHLKGFSERLDNSSSPVGISQIDCFIRLLKESELRTKSTALSVSVGDGIWDYLAFLNNKNIVEITAIDVVENPVTLDSMTLLRSVGKWEYKKVQSEKLLPFSNESFDLVFHQDVIEHVEKPFLFLSEQYRVLKTDGILILGTPNLLRPVNICRALLGRLTFPKKIGYNEEIGDYIHVQEFHEQHLKTMLHEVGFKTLRIEQLFWGIHPLTISRYPKGKIGRGMCHYLMVKCLK